MSDFTVIFTELPLDVLRLKCLIEHKDRRRSWWIVGETAIDKGFSKPAGEIIHQYYPDMNMYLSDSPLNSDMIDLASEYLDRVYQIIFVTLQTGNYPPREDMDKWVIDTEDRLPGKMPMIMDQELRSAPFNMYRFVKTGIGDIR